MLVGELEDVPKNGERSKIVWLHLRTPKINWLTDRMSRSNSQKKETRKCARVE